MKRITTAVALVVLVFSFFSVELRAQTRAKKSTASRKQPVDLIVSGGTIAAMGQPADLPNKPRCHSKTATAI